MKPFLLITLITTILPTTLLAQKDVSDEQWYELEKEVRYNPATEGQIDSIRKEYDVEKVTKAQPVSTSLPKYCKAVYSLNWQAFNAGFAIIEDWRDNEHFYVGGKAVTNKFISGLRKGKFRVRDWVYTVGDVDGLYPHFFEQHIEEGTYRKERWTLYDHKDEWLYKMNGDKLEEDTLKPFNQNYMSLLYNLRSSDLKQGDTLSFPTYVHGKNWDIKVVVHGREEVRVPAGKFKTIKVQPILVGDGQGFNKKDEMFIWFTDDERKLFIKGKAKARIGNIYAKLEHYEVKE